MLYTLALNKQEVTQNSSEVLSGNHVTDAESIGKFLRYFH